MTVFLALVPSDGALFPPPLSPNFARSSTASALASGMKPLEWTRRRNLLVGRVLVLCCFLHQKNLLGYIQDTSCTISVTLRVFHVKKAILRLYLQISCFIKTDSSVHIKPPFLQLLPVLEQCQTGGHPSLSAVMVLGKVTPAQRKGNPGSFHTVAVAV